MPHRFFILPDSIRDGVVQFSSAHAHQLRDVLRMPRGAEIFVLDNAGSEYRVVLSKVTPRGVQGEIVDRHPAAGEPHTRIVLYQALLKADKFEWVLQKGTEVGITAFVPIVTERSIRDVGKSKFGRWTQILTEAAEQAGRGKIPALSPHQPIASACGTAQAQGGLLLIPWELERERNLRSALDHSAVQTIHLFIGPEGGFSEQEVERARMHNALSVTLGPRILRAETAGLVAASAIFFARGDLSHT